MKNGNLIIIENSMLVMSMTLLVQTLEEIGTQFIELGIKSQLTMVKYLQDTQHGLLELTLYGEVQESMQEEILLKIKLTSIRISKKKLITNNNSSLNINQSIKIQELKLLKKHPHPSTFHHLLKQ